MPWAEKHRKEKVAELDKKRRPKRRKYFREYYHKKIKSDEKAYDKMVIRAKTRNKYGKPKKCEVCGSTFRVGYHHYTEPYDVDKFLVLCEYHHMLMDYKRRYTKTQNKKQV